MMDDKLSELGMSIVGCLMCWSLLFVNHKLLVWVNWLGTIGLV